MRTFPTLLAAVGLHGALAYAVSLAGACAVLATVAVVACAVPAWRATRLASAEALRGN